MPRPFLNLCLLICGIAGALPCASADDDALVLLARARKLIRNDAVSIPRLVCRQRLAREVYVQREEYLPLPPIYGSRRGMNIPAPHVDSCPRSEQPFDTKRFRLDTTDRAIFDVLLTATKEMFAWPQRTGFSSTSPSELLGGGFSGSGDFATFVFAIFTSAAANIEYRGNCESDACARFAYSIPLAASKWDLRSGYAGHRVGYHGIFDINRNSAELMAVTVTPDDISKALPHACALEIRMRYTQTADVAGGPFTIPKTTESSYLSSDGELDRNYAAYEGCHRYEAESTLHFDEAETTPAAQDTVTARQLPAPGTPFVLRLMTKIDSESSAAGEPIEAVLTRAVVDPQGHRLPAGTKFQGRLEEVAIDHDRQHPRVTIAMRFDSAVLDGVAVPVKLKALDGNDGKGRQMKRFYQKRAILNDSFQSRWAFD